MSNNRRDYFSASQIKTFKTCPKEYWYKYVSDKDPAYVEKGYLSLGSAVHETIEAVLLEYPDLRDRKQLEHKMQTHLENMDHGIPESMVDKAFTCVGNAAHYIAKQEDLDILGIEAEHKFDVNRPDISYPFLAIMDVTTSEGIVDWKTGNVYEDSERLQGGVYLAAYANMYGRVPEYVKFVYLKDREVNTYSRTDGNGHEFWSDEKMPDGWQEVIKIAKQLQKAWREDTWPAKPDTAPCYFCDYKNFCPQGKRGVDNVSFEKY